MGWNRSKLCFYEKEHCYLGGSKCLFSLSIYIYMMTWCKCLAFETSFLTEFVITLFPVGLIFNIWTCSKAARVLNMSHWCKKKYALLTEYPDYSGTFFFFFLMSQNFHSNRTVHIWTFNAMIFSLENWVVPCGSQPSI